MISKWCSRILMNIWKYCSNEIVEQNLTQCKIHCTTSYCFSPLIFLFVVFFFSCYGWMVKHTMTKDWKRRGRERERDRCVCVSVYKLKLLHTANMNFCIFMNFPTKVSAHQWNWCCWWWWRSLEHTQKHNLMSCSLALHLEHDIVCIRIVLNVFMYLWIDSV